MFLDISKAFDKVWHSGLLFKLKKNGICGNLLNWFTDYLKDRQQRVVVQGQSSNWGTVQAGVPQGSVLGPLLFLIFINDMVDLVNSNIKLFADDTSLYLTVDNPAHAAEIINSDLTSIDEWSKNWLITFNALKTDSMLISRKKNSPDHPPLIFQGHTLENVNSHKHLGITLRSDLKWTDHISSIINKSEKLLNIMKGLTYRLDRLTLESMYISFIRPILEYGGPIWDGCTVVDTEKLEKVQLAAARIVTGAFAGTANAKLYEELGWQTLAKRREKAKLIMMYKIENDLVPNTLRSAIPGIDNPATPIHDTRQGSGLSHFRARTDLFNNSFFPSTVRLWNELPKDIKNSESLSVFKSKLGNLFIQTPIPSQLYNHGNRFVAILHTRLRLGSSQLNSHLFKIGIKPTPGCSCGASTEDPWHFFFECPLFVTARSNLHLIISKYAPFSLNIVLYGSNKCTLHENIQIFSAVHDYINLTTRFSPAGIG